MTTITLEQLDNLIKELNDASIKTNYGILLDNAVVDFDKHEFRCDLCDTNTNKVYNTYKVPLSQLSDIDTLKLYLCFHIMETDLYNIENMDVRV